MAYHIWQVGLDIQNGFMRALAVQRRRQGWQLRQWWQIPLPTGTLRDGSLQDSNALCEALTQWRRTLPHRISLRLGFPAQPILQQRLKAPDNRVQEPARSLFIESQALRQFPVEGESLTLDYRVEPATPDTVLITAARRSEVEHWRQCLARAGLSLDVLDIVPCAIRSMAHAAGLPAESLLLHCLDGESWLWISPLSQPLAFGVIPSEEVAQTPDIVTCVSVHYQQACDATIYCSGVAAAVPPTSAYPLQLWSPFAVLQQVQPPLPHWPTLYVVAAGLALRSEDI